MSDITPDERMAARIAFQILKNAEDGSKLFTIIHHYPNRARAVSYGFYVTIGGIFALCFAIVAGGAGSFIIDKVFQ